MSIWEAINNARIKKGLSIQKLADESGVSINTIVGWIYQKNLPNIILLWQIADTLEISMDELIGRKFLSIDK